MFASCQLSRAQIGRSAVFRQLTSRGTVLRSHVRNNASLSKSPSARPVWKGALAVSVAALAIGGVFLTVTPRIQLENRQTAVAIPSKAKFISYDELQKHNSKESCWIMVRNKIYDVTKFLPQHPGGVNIVIANSGQDATAIFESLHSSGLLNSLLKPEQCLGMVDPATVPVQETVVSEDEVRVERARAEMPPVELMINLDDIEEVAHNVLTKIAWAYYSSVADGGHAFKENLEAFGKYWFRPRVLRKVRDVDMNTTILGIASPVPFFISPAAMAKLGHPDGEVSITRGAYRTGVIQGISSNASCTIDEIASARQGDQALIFQLYVHKDHSVSEATLRKVEALGFKGIMLTVDAPCLGKREIDMKARSLPVVKGSVPNAGGGRPLLSGSASSLSYYFDSNLNWEDLKWIRSVTKLPIIIKGIQTVEDVELAAQHGVDGVLLSNHGGRQLDYAPASIDILYELRKRRPDILDNKKMEIYCDGGVRRGTDILKALCLGATACGLGRPFLYANGAYGEDGVAKTVEILEEEIATGMRLLGVTRLDELKPEMVRRFDEHP